MHISVKSHLCVYLVNFDISTKVAIFANSNIANNMVGKYKVVTLCGSTKFKEQFIETQKRLTLEGHIVISVGLFGHSGDTEVWTEGTKAMLDDMHLRKIDMADKDIRYKRGWIHWREHS